MGPVPELPNTSAAWQRPRPLARLCIASFIDQGFAFLCFFFGLFGALFAQYRSLEQLQAPIRAAYAPLLDEQQLAYLLRIMELVHEHGVALMSVLLLRTVMRFVGTLRMWQGYRNGFHIYTLAQLLGVLLPMLVVGPEIFNFVGFACVLLWCGLYATQRHALR